MNAALKPMPIAIARPKPGPAFRAASGTSINVCAVVTVGDTTYQADQPIEIVDLVAGTDYAIRSVEGRLVASPCADTLPAGTIGGFHFAPGGNAEGRAGGDATPAINPCSIWDVGFRPACADPRGMALVEQLGRCFWCDIYLLGSDHLRDGTSRHGAGIADGKSLPQALDGKGRTKKLDYATAVAIYAHHGKGLLGAEEFFAAAFGVTERSSTDSEPKATGLDAPRTSRAGIMQATGNMWVWGTDGDPDAPRPSLFGGSWILGDLAGSRCALLDHWPDYSFVGLSARGRSDHLMLD